MPDIINIDETAELITEYLKERKFGSIRELFVTACGFV